MWNPYGFVKKGGTWSLPTTVYAARKLIDLVRDLERGEERPVLDKLHGTFGDDELFDKIDEAYDDFFENVVDAIKNQLASLIEEYRAAPETFKEAFDPQALKMLEQYLNL